MTRVTLPLRLASEANARGSWHAGAARARLARAQVNAALRRAEPGPLPLPVVVRITRVGPRRLDDDNLARSAKAVRDAVAGWLGCDDADPRVSWVYAQERNRLYSVEVIVSPREWWIEHGADVSTLYLVEHNPPRPVTGLVVQRVCDGGHAENLTLRFHCPPLPMPLACAAPTP